MVDHLYTYRNGKRLDLEKRPDSFIIRALESTLKAGGLPGGEQLSTASTRITVNEKDMETTMAKARGVAVTHHAYRTVSGSEDFLITDRIFIRFNPAVKLDEIDSLAGRYGLWQLEKFSDRDFLFQLSDHTGTNPVKLVVALTENEKKRVELVEHDLNYSATPCQVPLPTDHRYKDQWHLHTRSRSTLFDQRASSRAEAAWQLLRGFGDSRVVVGVTDDGCDLSHHDFNSPGKFAGWGYCRGTTLITDRTIGADPDNMYQHRHNHGTSCAGVIAGEADAVLTVGAAPGCRLFPIKWPSGTDGGLYIGDARLIKMLDFIGDKVDILSNSWGSSPVSNVNLFVKNKIEQLARTGGRRKKGILFLWAAGNENCPIEHTADVDVPYTSGITRYGGQYYWTGVRTARRFRHNLTGVPGVMYVAALASNARRSHYSNYGTGIDICAPSSNSHTYGRGNAPGLGIVTTSGGVDTAVEASFGGTSSATPLTAGVAALVISANPELTAVDIAAILKRTASKDLDPTPYPKTQPASFDPDTSWDVSPIAPFDAPAFKDTGSEDGTWSPWFGHGRVDALKAVEQAIEMGTPVQQIRLVQDTPQEIPDNKADGIVSRIDAAQEGTVRDLNVRVDISHTYIGDLYVALTGPGGETAVLHNRQGRSRDDLKTTFTLQNNTNLQQFIDQPFSGTWTLKIADRAGWDRGRLNRWSILADIA